MNGMYIKQTSFGYGVFICNTLLCECETYEECKEYIEESKGNDIEVA